MPHAVLVALLAAAFPPGAAAAASTIRVSVDSNGEQATRASGEYGPSGISGDGGLVAFVSSSPNLVPGDTNGRDDVFVRDIAADRTTLVSHDEQPAPQNGVPVLGPMVSRDGRTVAYLAPYGECRRVYVHDRVAGTTQLVPTGRTDVPDVDLNVVGYALSPDGRYVVMLSAREVSGGNCEEAPLDGGGADIADGAITVFDRETAASTPVDTDSLVRYGGQVAASDGARIVLITRTAGSEDVYAIDRASGRRSQVNLDSRERRVAGGIAFGGVISANGRVAAFSSPGRYVRGDSGRDDDVYVRDLRRGRTTRVSVGNRGGGLGENRSPSISADGTRIAFTSSRRGSSATDIFLHDTVTRTTRLVSVARGGGRAGQSVDPSISADGRFVAFTSRAADLVPADTNRRFDVFVRGPFPIRRPHP